MNKVTREQLLQECVAQAPFQEYRDGVEFMTGKTMKSVENTGAEIVFTTVEDEVFVLYHSQDCCESVYVEDVCGDLSDLVGTPMLYAAEVSNEGEEEPKNPSDYEPESHTWTFYKFSTIHGSVTVRFYGTSNGYYSEGVSFTKRG
jgi:hypothetical protein